MLSSRLGRRRSPSFSNLYDISDDEKESVKSQAPYFVPIEQGCGLGHVFCNQDASTSNLLKQIRKEYFRKSSLSTSSLGNSPDASHFSSYSEKEAKGKGRQTLPSQQHLEDLEARDESWIGRIIQLEQSHHDEVSHLEKSHKDEVEHLHEEFRILKIKLDLGVLTAPIVENYLEEQNDKETDDLEEGKSEVEDLKEENKRLEEENAALNDKRRELERENANWEVAVREQRRSIKCHIETNNALEAEKRNLKSKLARVDSVVFRENVQLKEQVADLENTSSGFEAQLENLANEIANCDVKMNNYGKVFERYHMEWKGAREKIEELQGVIRTFPDHPLALLEAIAKRDKRILHLRESVKVNRVCDKALKWAYPKFIAKYNEVVGLANERLDVGVILSQRLAEVEAYLLREGHASPISDRELVLQGAHEVFGINQSGVADQNENGDYWMFAHEVEIADNPNGWLPDLLKRIWRDEVEAIYYDHGNRAEVRRNLTWLDGEEGDVDKTESRTEEGQYENRNSDDTDESDDDDEAPEIFKENEGARGESYDNYDADPDELSRDSLEGTDASTPNDQEGGHGIKGDDLLSNENVVVHNESAIGEEPITLPVTSRPGCFEVPYDDEEEEEEEEAEEDDFDVSRFDEIVPGASSAAAMIQQEEAVVVDANKEYRTSEDGENEQKAHGSKNSLCPKLFGEEYGLLRCPSTSPPIAPSDLSTFPIEISTFLPQAQERNEDAVNTMISVDSSNTAPPITFSAPLSTRSPTTDIKSSQSSDNVASEENSQLLLLYACAALKERSISNGEETISRAVATATAEPKPTGKESTNSNKGHNLTLQISTTETQRTGKPTTHKRNAQRARATQQRRFQKEEQEQKKKEEEEKRQKDGKKVSACGSQSQACAGIDQAAAGEATSSSPKVVPEDRRGLTPHQRTLKRRAERKEMKKIKQGEAGTVP